MADDRPSRMLRLEHEAGTGLPVLVPVTDPPPSPTRPQRPSLPPGRAQSWALVIVAVLGAGGAPSLVAALRGDEQARATEELSRQVQALSGSVARLEAAHADTSRRLVELRALVEAREQARREQLQLARSHLTQPPRPDVPGALKALDE